ncbi:receptor activity-modifying protein 2 [Lepisosteus oculatus]|uniref:receptor activity-modifying protein 2 n=1 Tax=Lepisosteus oculatus TaxID=7918 RepID=UPI00370FF50D
MNKLLNFLIFPLAFFEANAHQGQSFSLHCNETLLEEFSMYCWLPFHGDMSLMQKDSLCDWNKVIRSYNTLTICMQHVTEMLSCYYPNPKVQDFFLQIHSQYFQNCTEEEEEVFTDPPEAVVLTLIIVPVCLIPVLVTLVVWKSRIREQE